jgi:YD repeat-containing protein
MKRTLFTILLAVLISPVFAGVNYRNGNFYISYSDIEFPNTNMSITRSYNSFNTSAGLFGYGWGTLMETRLYPLPEGTLYVKWWGGGGEDIFEPATLNREGLFYMINAIIQYEISNDKLDNTPVAILQRKAVLATEAGKRMAKYIELLDKKIVAPWKQPANAKKIWKRNVNQVIVWNGNNYALQNWNDQYVFNQAGLMTDMTEPTTRMQLFYNNNLLSGILVDGKQHCSISTDSSGKITRLLYKDSSGNKEASFKYDLNNNLVYSKDAGDNEYWFSYDKAHNMVRIGYADSTSLEISYDPVTNRAIRVKNKNGSAVAYQYPFFYTADGKINTLHYATRIKRFDSTGMLSFSEYYEYESRTKPDGEDYLYRTLEQTDTSYSEALYAANVGNAYYRKKNNREAWADYDNKIRCTYLHINDSVYRCSYNLQDKPDQFWQIDSLRKDSTLYRYTYDQSGNLKETRKNEQRYLIRGSKEEGRIEVTKDALGLLIKFKNGQPFSIENKQWGLLLLNEKTDAKVEKSAPVISVTEDRNERSDINKMEEAKARAMAARNKSQSEKSDHSNPARLLILFNEFKDIMEPKLIAHEWIWERL